MTISLTRRNIYIIAGLLFCVNWILNLFFFEVKEDSLAEELFFTWSGNFTMLLGTVLVGLLMGNLYARPQGLLSRRLQITKSRDVWLDSGNIALTALFIILTVYLYGRGYRNAATLLGGMAIYVFFSKVISNAIVLYFFRKQGESRGVIS